MLCTHTHQRTFPSSLPLTHAWRCRICCRSAATKSSSELLMRDRTCAMAAAPTALSATCGDGCAVACPLAIATRRVSFQQRERERVRGDVYVARTRASRPGRAPSPTAATAPRPGPPTPHLHPASVSHHSTASTIFSPSTRGTQGRTRTISAHSHGLKVQLSRRAGRVVRRRRAEVRAELKRWQLCARAAHGHLGDGRLL
jgi:hypothetical protein